MDYLAKRLDSFDRRELAQFQGVAVNHDYFDMTDLINLSFCCQSATVVQNLSDLDSIGREHYLDLHGGVPVDELKSINFRKIALSLLLNEEGKVTPYGVVYDNGMRLEQLYDRCHFPDYVYSSDTILTAAVTKKNIPEDIAPITWLHLPMADCQIERAMLRGGIATLEDIRVRYSDNELPPELNGLLTNDENLHDVNGLCLAFVELDCCNRQKFGAALRMLACFEGMVMMDASRTDCSPIPVERLINMTHRMAECQVAREVFDDESLGKFYVDNGFASILEDLPEQFFWITPE